MRVTLQLHAVSQSVSQSRNNASCYIYTQFNLLTACVWRQLIGAIFGPLFSGRAFSAQYFAHVCSVNKIIIVRLKWRYAVWHVIKYFRLTATVPYC